MITVGVVVLVEWVVWIHGSLRCWPLSRRSR